MRAPAAAAATRVFIPVLQCPSMCPVTRRPSASWLHHVQLTKPGEKPLHRFYMELMVAGARRKKPPFAARTFDCHVDREVDRVQQIYAEAIRQYLEAIWRHLRHEVRIISSRGRRMG